MKLTRSSSDSMIAGVCSGFARAFDLDASAVRVGFVLLSVLSAAFPGVLVYLVCWAVIPESP